ncbi:NUDIX hydrolase [Macrococcus equipercicus]|uniref:NUDIX domain-containing protein n=1 Tax=Macrococcus equipercicus TaxID=69967 RepID=A0A9Q9BQ21_9STAP|nr:NUDIX domain-containing protein [Macrococcus equipercicus]UTH13369.1 NUDIX domain-containing protein [Macrococcus equipercicus]
MDLSLLLDSHKLNMRTSAIIRRGDEWLMHYGVNDEFITTVGGRIKLLEDSQSALIRELKEELNLTVSANELQFKTIIESFFDYRGTHYHELLFVYLLEVGDELGEGEIFAQPDPHFVFKFYSAVELDQEIIKPQELKVLMLGKDNHGHYIADNL